MEEKKQQIVDSAGVLLAAPRQGKSPVITDIALLAGDGSQRIFYRLRLETGPSIVAVMPNEDNPLGKSEAASTWKIGAHLHRAGVPVPRPLAYEPDSGLVLFEDLGDVRLYDVLSREEGLREDYLFKVYRDVVRELVRMQVGGREGFDTSWCWQTPRYDRRLMLERESGYFLQALCRDFFGMEPDMDTLNREFVLIADRAARAPADFFLHRDFQSRNIMITDDGSVRIIDFQGGRLGPLAYDLASLLIDPYVGISAALQETMLDEYISELAGKVQYDPFAFREEYLYLAMQRTLQILGAFAFLGRQRSKTFFLQFIYPALVSMRTLLQKTSNSLYPALSGIIDICLEKSEGESV